VLLGALPLAFGLAQVLFRYSNLSPLANDFRGALWAPAPVTVRNSP
jgi:hypothetical protein